nr:MAG TPA: hypothetical protein [Caudoviricetes sp.]
MSSDTILLPKHISNKHFHKHLFLFHLNHKELKILLSLYNYIVLFERKNFQE